MKHQARYDPLSLEDWDFGGYGTVDVGDMFFDDSYLIHLVLDEITLEPITGDPMETRFEPVFWLSSKDMNVTKELSESEMRVYL